MEERKSISLFVSFGLLAIIVIWGVIFGYEVILNENISNSEMGYKLGVGIEQKMEKNNFFFGE